MASLTDLVMAIKEIQKWDDRTKASLTDYTKKTNIYNRLYIESTIAEDDIATPLVTTLNQLVCSYVFTALQLNQFVSGTTTVKELVQLVSTEALVDAVEVIDNKFGASVYNKPVVSVEGINSDGAVKIDSPDLRLVSGRVLDIDLGIPVQGKVEKITIRVYVQLVPYTIAPEIMSQFVKLNFNPSTKIRFRQVLAGEISFIKDFILARDIIEREKEALRNDKNNVLYDMLVQQKNALAKWLFQFTPIRPENHNSASSIMVFDKKTIQMASAENYFDFNRKADRERFFKKTFSMIVCVVDTAYAQVEMYFNGIDAKGSYPFSMLQKASNSKDLDLKTIMSTFAQGMSPKF